MPLKGFKHSEETKKKIGLAQIGRKSPMEGKRHTEEAKKKISMRIKGKKHTEETKRKIGFAQKGSKHHMYGKTHTKEAKLKLSKAFKGRTSPMKGRKFTDKHRKKLSLSHRGEKSSLWKGGISSSPYGKEFTLLLKEAIRYRDGYTCVVCSNIAKNVHHIDYDKQNNTKINLVVLCRNCHALTNNNRDYWQGRFDKWL